MHRSAWDTGVTPWAPLWSRKDPPGVDAQTAPVGAYPMALRVEAGPSEDDAPQTGPADPDEAEALRRENAQLRRALDSRAVIDQATGALMLRYGLEAPTALAVLKRWSQSSNIAVNRIADTLVNVVCRHAPHQDADHGLADWLREQVNAPLTRSDGEASREW